MWQVAKRGEAKWSELWELLKAETRGKRVARKRRKAHSAQRDPETRWQFASCVQLPREPLKATSVWGHLVCDSTHIKLPISILVQGIGHHLLSACHHPESSSRKQAHFLHILFPPGINRYWSWFKEPHILFTSLSFFIDIFCQLHPRRLQEVWKPQAWVASPLGSPTALCLNPLASHWLARTDAEAGQELNYCWNWRLGPSSSTQWFHDARVLVSHAACTLSALSKWYNQSCGTFAVTMFQVVCWLWSWINRPSLKKVQGFAAAEELTPDISPKV